MFEHSQMGMGNQRNDLPTRQWELLQLFAKHRGELTWSDFGADPRNEHRRLILSKHLREFFGLDGDPFDKLPAGRGWRTRCTMIPEARFEPRNFAILGKESSKKLRNAEPEYAQRFQAGCAASSGLLSGASRKISPVARDRAMRPPRQRRRNPWSLPTATTVFTRVPFSSSATMPGSSPGAVRCPVWSSKTTSRT